MKRFKIPILNEYTPQGLFVIGLIGLIGLLIIALVVLAVIFLRH